MTPKLIPTITSYMVDEEIRSKVDEVVDNSRDQICQGYCLHIDREWADEDSPELAILDYYKIDELNLIVDW